MGIDVHIYIEVKEILRIWSRTYTFEKLYLSILKTKIPEQYPGNLFIYFDCITRLLTIYVRSLMHIYAHI